MWPGQKRRNGSNGSTPAPTQQQERYLGLGWMEWRWDWDVEEEEIRGKRRGLLGEFGMAGDASGLIGVSACSAGWMGSDELLMWYMYTYGDFVLIYKTANCKW